MNVILQYIQAAGLLFSGRDRDCSGTSAPCAWLIGSQ